MPSGLVLFRWRDGASAMVDPVLFSKEHSSTSSRYRATLHTWCVNVRDVIRNWVSARGDSGNGVGSRSAIRKVVHGAPDADGGVGGAGARRVKSASPFQKKPISSSPLSTMGSSHTLKSE